MFCPAPSASGAAFGLCTYHCLHLIPSLVCLLQAVVQITADWKNSFRDLRQAVVDAQVRLSSLCRVTAQVVAVWGLAMAVCWWDECAYASVLNPTLAWCCACCRLTC
jgi:hypothetical protein